MNNNSEFMPVECLNVPKVLFYDKQYEDLSMDAKLIYALLLDRKEMAIRNEWVDEYGDTYVIYPKQEIKKYLNISRYRIDQALAELEEHDQMVEVAVPYPGKLCQFYVKDITDNEKQMEEDIMKKMKESNGENFCRASGCGYARCFTGISPKYMAKMNKEDRNNFQTAIEEILEDLNLGGHVTAEPLMSERSRKMQYNRKMINGVVFLEEQADYLLLLGKEGLYTVQAENDHWNVHYTLPGDTSNLDKQFISKDEALQDVYEMNIWRRNRWKFLPMKELRTRLKKLLMEAGFTQAELAEMVENCKDNIRRLERNKFLNPTYQLHHDFTEFFEKPVEEILGYEEI